MSDEYKDLLKMLSDQNVTLARIDANASHVKEKFEVIDRRLDSHAGKIRALEHWRWGLAGGLAALGMLVKWIKGNVTLGN